MFYPDNGSNDPHTHALIIGVGGYPYLPDGKSPNPDVITYFGELTQLTSASRTARWDSTTTPSVRESSVEDTHQPS